MGEGVGTHWPHGHYYSPVVDPGPDVRAYWEQEQRTLPDGLHGIPLSLPGMVAFWQAHAEFLLAHPFPDRPSLEQPGTTRFHNENGAFPGGDAVFLGAILRAFRPRRIIEVGSGHSTAAMLDWRDRLGLDALHITCVEPAPARLHALLRPGDPVTVLPHPVQAVPLDLYRELQAGDVLFIDSTHVLKTGSDVHFELFHILPILAPGVIVHFHDCAYPFEYPAEAVFGMNFSWNEAYAVRAFLMFNRAFRVLFWNSMFHRLGPPGARAQLDTLSRNPGGGLWIVRTEHQ